MNTGTVLIGVALCAGLVAVGGCKKEEPTVQTEGQKAGEAVTGTAAKTVDAVKSAATQVTAQAAEQVKAVEQQAQGLIDRAKSLVAEKKYQEALTSLNGLTNLKLTPDQQKLVDDLKTQIQSALTKAAGTDPAAALGGALGGKK